jgi:hypothetical protein
MLYFRPSLWLATAQARFITRASLTRANYTMTAARATRSFPSANVQTASESFSFQHATAGRVVDSPYLALVYYPFPPSLASSPKKKTQSSRKMSNKGVKRASPGAEEQKNPLGEVELSDDDAKRLGEIQKVMQRAEIALGKPLCFFVGDIFTFFSTLL